jgi:pyruvate/2-oxoglutarate dehydrogenase complex dihydrolipoamide dehydrogenase (E3) component
MMPENITSPVLRDDRSNRELLENVHPLSWENPTPSAKYDLVILGAGPAGLLTAYEAATLGAKVAIIERDLLGGECLNTGCIPSKTIIRTSRLYAEMRDAENFGARVPGDVHVDFPFLVERMRRIRARISRQGFSARQLSLMGIDVYFGEGRFAQPNAVVVGATTLRFKKALIATGSRLIIPSIPGLVEAGYLTNENVFDLTESPRRFLVIGGGPLGCELAQAFCRLGSQVAIVQKEPMFLSQEERDAAQILSDSLARDGIDIHLNTEVVRVRMDGNEKVIDLVSDGYKSKIVVDEILIGVGRTPNVENLAGC